MANQPVSSCKHEFGHESKEQPGHSQSQNVHQPSTMKADSSQLLVSTGGSVNSGSTVNTTIADSPVVAWVMSDQRRHGPFVAIAEIVGTAPTYVTGTQTAQATMTTIASQGSTGSDGGNENDRDESLGKNKQRSQNEKGEEKKHSKKA